MLTRQSILLALSTAALPLSQGLAVIERQDDGNVTELFKRLPPPGPMFLKAPALDKEFQPALDFDKDSCYNTPAMGPGPNFDLATGLEPEGPGTSAGCREELMLDRCNVYSRQRCNHGYCAIMYAYYFQKDQSTPGIKSGHKHDWEHIVVWVRMSDKFVSHVSVSQHKGYESKANHQIHWTAQQNGHPEVVYHKDGPSTHCFRFANGADSGNGGPENHKRQWILGPLIGHYGWDTTEQRTRMYTHAGEGWGDAALAITDDHFAGNLEKARPKRKVGSVIDRPPSNWEIPEFEFDVNVDDPNTNNI